MKKTSRRTFAKSMTAALAAAPVALAFKTDAHGQGPQKATTVEPSPQRIFNHQDTPPPVIFEEGSLKLDVLAQNLGTGQELPPDPQGGYRWQFPKTNAQNDIFVVGVKIVDSSGKVWFYLDRDRIDPGDRANPISILFHMEGADNDRKHVILSTQTKYVTLKSPQNRELRRNHQNGTPIPDPPSTNRMRYRYLDGNGNAGNYSIKAVAIAIGPPAQRSVISRIKLSDLPGDGADMKVMVWFADVNHNH